MSQQGWKLEGKVSSDDVKFTRKQRTSKYDVVVNAIMQAKPNEYIVLDLSPEKDPKGAAQRIAVAVRKCAEGKIDGKIRSRYDDKSKKLFLKEEDEATAEARAAARAASKQEGDEAEDLEETAPPAASNGSTVRRGRKKAEKAQATA